MQTISPSSFRPRRVAIAAIVGALFALGWLSYAPSAKAGCINTLPMSWSLRSYYAASWTRTMRIDVRTNGPAIRSLSVSVSTFHGDQLGKGSLRRTLTSVGSIILKLKYPMQPGRYTLYFYGFPNSDPSCGPKHMSSVLRLSSCGSQLPVNFLNTPQGYAAAYGGWYSFEVRPQNGMLLKNLNSTLSTFSGMPIGSKRIPVLFGDLTISIPLHQAIQPGGYTLNVAGFPPGRPLSCGPAHATKTLTFKAQPT
jgi:hypothetical protein